MTHPKCETCRWWEPGPFPCDVTLGQCHIRSVPSDDFPDRGPDDWCGEHAERETEAKP